MKKTKKQKKCVSKSIFKEFKYKIKFKMENKILILILKY